MTLPPDSPRELCQTISHYIGEIRSMVPLGEGLDHAALLVNGGLVVRESRDPDPASRADTIRREVRVLRIVVHHSPLAVPEIVFSDPECGVLAYHVLPGLPALDVPGAHLSIDTALLGSFMTALHRIPLQEVKDIVPRDDQPLHVWLEEAIAGYEEIASHLPASAREHIEAFLTQSLPQEPTHLIFCHNDLGAEHILIDPVTMRITGIIDWTDAAIADPMRDLALIFRDFGPDVLERVVSSCGIDVTPEDHERLVFYARCKLIEDLAYGIETGSSRYTEAGLAHLDWVFG